MLKLKEGGLYAHTQGKFNLVKKIQTLLPHKQTLGLGWVNPETRKVKRRLKGNALQV